jgi:peroxiredoxin
VAQPSATVAVGSPAPDFSLPAAGGGHVRLGDHRARVVVLVYLRGFA